MKKYFLSVIVIINTILAHSILAQDKLIKLSPEIKDTIDLFEREYYNLYPGIEDFYYAMIYLKSDSTTVTKIICRNDEGLVRDSVITNNADYVGNLKTSIRQINLDRLENYESNDKIAVTKLDGNQLVGKLLAVQDSSFIIVPEEISEVGTLTFLESYTKLKVQDIQSVLIDFGYWSDVGNAASIGVGVGIASGFVIGFLQPISQNGNSMLGDTESIEKFGNGLLGSLIGMGIGGAVGFGIGLILATPDETIEVNSASDIEQLKGYLVE